MGLMLDSSHASWPEIERATGLIALLPVGALEQHGPHLPLDTDTVLATGVARRIAAETGGWLLPAIGYGEAWTAEDWPGTISLSAETLQRTIEDVVPDLDDVDSESTPEEIMAKRAAAVAAAKRKPAVEAAAPAADAAPAKAE